MTASTWLGPPSSAASRCAPSPPSDSPSSEASTSVCREALPLKMFPNWSRAAVSAALVVRSGAPTESRAAATTISRVLLPGRRPTTLTSAWP